MSRTSDRRSSYRRLLSADAVFGTLSLAGILARSAADVCAGKPEHTARPLLGQSYESGRNVALDLQNSLPGNARQHLDATDTIQFHGNPLHEVGTIKTTPQKILEVGTECRVLSKILQERKT